MNDTKRPKFKKNKRLELILFFAGRHWRAIVGLLIFTSVVGLIYYTSVTPIKPKTRGAWSKVIPTAKIDGKPKMDSGNEAQKTTIGETQRVIEPTSTATGETTNDGAEKPNPPTDVQATSLKLEEFLARGTKEQFIENILTMRRDWAKNKFPVAFLIVQRRARIARRLIEMDVTDDELLFAYNEYIEAIVTLDGLNCEGKMEVPGIRDAFLEVGEKFSSNPDPVIAAKASIIYVLAPAHNYFLDKNPANLSEFADQFDIHANKIMGNPQTTIRLVKMLDDLYHRSNFLPSVQACSKRVLKHLEASSDEKILKLGRELRESIYFSKVDLPSIVDRIEGGNAEARSAVQEFYENLAANPNCRLEIYRVAVDVVAEYKRLEANSDAEALANWLTTILAQNRNKEVREEIDTLLVELMK